MKISNPFLINTAGCVMASVMRRWMDTLDYRCATYDPSVETSLREPRHRRIYLFWHEYILLPLDRRGRTDVTMLLSRHRDADVLSRIAMHYGFGVVRGSTFDGGTASLRELIRVARTNHLTMTPDGPRGPRRQMATGPVYLASKLGMPIVPMGFGFDRPWRFNSWDRFALPRPFSRARTIWGPEMHIPKRLDRDGLEHYRAEVQRMIEFLTTDAEQWAESGTTRIGERPFEREFLRDAIPADASPQELDRDPAASANTDDASAADSSRRLRIHAA